MFKRLNEFVEDMSNISNILLNGSGLILERVFDRIGFGRINDEVFRKLIKARLSYPASKAATHCPQVCIK